MLQTENKIIDENKTKKRLDYIDIAKGIGIILMIIGHAPLKNKYITNFIFSFHMPLFFLISGYFFKPKEKKQCIKDIFKRLIIPYIITCIAIIAYKILKLVLNKDFMEIQSTFKIWTIASLYGSGTREDFNIQPIGAIWFLLALGFATYFMNCIYSKKYRYILVFIIAYIGYKTTEFVWLPLSIQAGMTSLIFVYLGVIAKENDILNKSISKELYIALIFIVGFCTKYSGILYMVGNVYQNGLLDVIGALAGSFLVIKASYLIQNNLKFLKTCIQFIGKNSLLFLCVHLFSLNCLQWTILNNKLLNIGIKNEELRVVFINILSSILVVLTIDTIKKMKYCFILKLKRKEDK